MENLRNCLWIRLRGNLAIRGVHEVVSVHQPDATHSPHACTAKTVIPVCFSSPVSGVLWEMASCPSWRMKKELVPTIIHL